MGEAIRWARWSEFKRQRQVAGDQFSPQTVSLVELDKVVPTLETLDYITRRLNRPEGHFYPLYIEAASDPKHLVEVAKRLITAQRFGEAERAMDKAWELSDSSKDTTACAALLVQRSRLLRTRRSLDDALDLVLRLLDETPERRFPLRAAMMQAELGYIYMKLRLYDEGYRANSRALSLHEMAGNSDPDTARRITQNMGWLLWGLHAYDGGLRWFEKALELALDLGRHHDVADIKHGMAMCWWGKEEPVEALRCMQEAVPGLRGADQQLARVNTGVILYDLGRDEEALAHYQQVIDARGEMAPVLGEMYLALNEKGRVLLDLGRLEEAALALDDAWRIVRETRDWEEQARNLLYRSEVARARGEQELRLKLLREAAALDFRHPKLTPLIHIKIAQSQVAAQGTAADVDAALRAAEQHLSGRR